jgi:hypothetical protein
VLFGDRNPSNAFANALLRFPRLLLSSIGISEVHYIDSPLPLDGTADASTNDARELLATHRHDASNSEADQEDHANSEQSDEPECDTDILLLACRASPDSGLDLAVAPVFFGGGALAAVAVSVVSLGGVAVVELLAALAVSSAVAGGLLTLLLRGEAGGENTAQRRALVGLGEGSERSRHWCSLNGGRG